MYCGAVFGDVKVIGTCTQTRIKNFVSYFKVNCVTERLLRELMHCEPERIKRSALKSFSVQIWPKNPRSLEDLAKEVAVEKLSKKEIESACLPAVLKQSLLTHNSTLKVFVLEKITKYHKVTTHMILPHVEAFRNRMIKEIGSGFRDF